MADGQWTKGWDGHHREQLRARLRLSPQQRLDWLWQAKLFAERAMRAAAARAAERIPAPKP